MASIFVPAIGDERPLTPQELEDLEKWRAERRAEKAVLEARIKEIIKDLEKMPEWKCMDAWNLAYEEMQEHLRTDCPSEYMDEAEDEATRIWVEKEKYKKNSFLPALEAHPLGPEYMTARGRLKDLGVILGT